MAEEGARMEEARMEDRRQGSDDAVPGMMIAYGDGSSGDIERAGDEWVKMLWRRRCCDPSGGL